jgi:predicted glycosyltransferase
LSESSLPKPLYKALSTDLHSQIDFYILKDGPAAADVKAKLGLDSVSLPTLVVWNDGEAHRYEGPFQYAKLKRWLEDPATSAGKGRTRKTAASDEL